MTAIFDTQPPMFRQRLGRWRKLRRSIIVGMACTIGLHHAHLAAASTAELAKEWLGGLSLPAQVRTALSIRLDVDQSEDVWLVEQNGMVYSLGVEPIMKELPGMAKTSKLKIAEMRSRHRLIYYAAGDFFIRQGFANREAITKALATVDSETEGQLLPGIQSKAEILENAALALSWIAEDKIKGNLLAFKDVSGFLHAYCRAIYPTALALHREGRHHEALVLYKEMYARQCSQPLNYFLDAAESFSALKQLADAQRMAAFVLKEYGSQFDSQQLERAGDILFNATDEAGAQAAYEKAIEMLIGNY